jgi:peptide/nickel transport system substrate-binding protein
MIGDARFLSLLEEAKSGSLSRRDVIRRGVALGLSMPLISMLLAACGGDEDDATPTPAPAAADPTPVPDDDDDDTETPEPDDDDDAETPEPDDDDDAETPEPDDDASAGEGRRGGKLIVAAIGEPATLDEHQTTASITAEIGYCMYETLFAYDHEYQPLPMLAESYNVSDDGLNHTFKLRQGVLFHNGDEMTSEDVVACMQRWGEISGVGKALFAATESIEATDDYTIEMVTSKPYGTILIALCSNTQACTIHPKEVIDEFGLDPISDNYIGTGPYKFAGRQADAYIRFERFDDYSAIEGDTDGYGGHKYQWVDEIEFVPVPDEAARVAGMQAGDYHIVMQLSNDHYDTLKDASNLFVDIRPPSNWDVFFLNWEQPMMADPLIRKAFQAALDHMPILQSSRGGGDFVQLDPSLMMQPTPWYSTAGEELYDIADPELAAQYLEDAGYDGTPMRFMATQEYSYMYGAAVVAKQQLEEAGFVVDLQVTDWATVLERRAQKDAWDVFVTGHGFVPDPSQITYVGQMNIYPGWWSDEESLSLAAELLSEPDFEKRFELWEQIQLNAYEQVPAVKTGDSSVISVWSLDVGGYTDQLQRGVPYWNVWLEG